MRCNGTDPVARKILTLILQRLARILAINADDVAALRPLIFCNWWKKSVHREAFRQY